MPEVFHIVPANARSFGFLWPAGLLFVVLLGTMFLLAASLRGSRRATFEVSADGLRVRGDLYGRRVPAAQLRGGAARVVDLGSEKRLRPVARTIGTALSGYRAGWFRLANGEKALLYVTDQRRVVYVPTRAGYALLLSVDRPSEFIERLRSISPAT